MQVQCTCLCTYIYVHVDIILYFSEPSTAWTSTLRDVSVSSFQEEVGPTARLAPSVSVLSLFQMFFTQQLIATIVEQTNEYAHLVLGDTRPWEEVTANDVWAFFGFCILMGINRLPALHHY